jgi:hypothetical protein
MRTAALHSDNDTALSLSEETLVRLGSGISAMRKMDWKNKNPGLVRSSGVS